MVAVGMLDGLVKQIMESQFGQVSASGVTTLNEPVLNDAVMNGGEIEDVEISGDLVDADSAIVDDADATKRLEFDVAGFTTATTRTVTVDDADQIMASTNTTQAVSGVKTFAHSSLKVAGSTSGSITLKAPAIASTYVHTLPAATDTLVGAAATQTLTNKTFTAPTLTDPIVTGMEVKGGVAGSGGTTVQVRKRNTNLSDNTTAPAFAVTVPNAIHGAAIRVTVMGVLGDGDSTDSKVYMIGVSRVAGAAAKAVVSSAAAVGATAGAGANAVVTVSVSAIGGAVGATNTFDIEVKVARSAGASTNHYTVAEAMLFNAFDTGVTIAAA